MNHELPRYLQQVTVPLLPESVCETVPGYDGNTMLCAGYMETGGKDSCQVGNFLHAVLHLNRFRQVHINFGNEI